MIAPVVEFGGPTVRVASNPLSHLQVSPVLQVVGDSRRPEAVARESASKICVSNSALNHLVGVRSVDGLVRKLLGSSDCAPEEQAVWLPLDSGRVRAASFGLRKWSIVQSVSGSTP